MGKGYNNYMCKKPFHPGSKANIKRAWMAEQKTDNEKKKQEELKVQYEKEQDLYNNRALLSTESKDKLELNFMYQAPPGAKRERQKEDDEPEYKFEWQRKYNAPREDYAKGNADIKDQPFGIPVRNVRCIKCHKWGHINTDKECPLYSQASTSSMPTTSMDPMELMRQMREDGFGLKENVLGHHLNPKAANQQLIPSDESDPEMEFLKSLSTTDKKKLLRKLKKLSKKQKKSAHCKKKKSKKSKKSKPKDSDESDSEHKTKTKPSKSDSSSDSSSGENSQAKKSKRKKKKSHSADSSTKGQSKKSASKSIISSNSDTETIENTKPKKDQKKCTEVKQTEIAVINSNKKNITIKEESSVSLTTISHKTSKHVEFNEENKHKSSKKKEAVHSELNQPSKKSISKTGDFEQVLLKHQKVKRSSSNSENEESVTETKLLQKSIKKKSKSMSSYSDKQSHKMDGEISTDQTLKRKVDKYESLNEHFKRKKQENSEESNSKSPNDIQGKSMSQPAHPDGFSHLCPQAKVNANYLIADEEYEGGVHDSFRHFNRDKRSPSVKQKYNK